MADQLGFVVTRTATRILRHPCAECDEPISTGQQYEEHKLPPGGELGYEHWQRAVMHAPSRYKPALAKVTGCELIDAYRENAEREAVSA